MLAEFTFHHIGIATPNIEGTSKYYIEAGFAMTDIIIDPIQRVKITFLTKANMPTIELLEPNDADSPVTKILEKSGVTPYHICYEVECLEQTIIELKKKKYIPLSKPVNAIALQNRRICFLFNKEVGLIELLEK